MAFRPSHPHPRRILLACAALPMLIGPIRPAHAQTASPTLQTVPGFAALPETLSNPGKAQAPLAVHTGDWGVFNRLDGSPAGLGPVARYGVSRWAEDWSVLRDRRLHDRNDPFDPLKFIALNDAKDIFLTLSGESRLKNWFENRPFLGQQKPGDSGRTTLRNLLGADLHLGPHLRVYGELVNGDAFGEHAYGYTSTYRTRLDVQQLFVEARARLAGAQTGVLFGRQQFLDAPNYVLYARDTPDVPLSWNGVRGYAVWPRVRLDAWDFTQTNTTPPALLADTENYNARLFGGYASYAPPDYRLGGQPGQTFLDLFYIGYELGGAPAAIATATGTQNGSTLRDNYGTRIWGRAGPIEFSLGAIYQGGQFRYAASTRTRDVVAWATNNFVGYRLGHVYTRPLFGLQADVYSGGDERRRTGTEGTYLTPYNPQTNYLDTTTYIAPGNLVNIAPTVELVPGSTTLLRFKVPVLWRQTTDDTIYGSSNRIYPFRGTFRGGFVGTVPQINFAWRILRHLTWNQDLARFLVSRSLGKAGASNGTYYLSTLAFRF